MFPVFWPTAADLSIGGHQTVMPFLNRSRCTLALKVTVLWEAPPISVVLILLKWCGKICFVPALQEGADRENEAVVACRGGHSAAGVAW